MFVYLALTSDALNMFNVLLLDMFGLCLCGLKTGNALLTDSYLSELMSMVVIIGTSRGIVILPMVLVASFVTLSREQNRNQTITQWSMMLCLCAHPHL
jgi:hypothetical protein